MSPGESDDLTEIIEEREGRFVVLRSPETAEHEPDYFEVATFPTHEQAEAYLTVVTEEELAMAQARGLYDMRCSMSSLSCAAIVSGLTRTPV